MSITEQYFDKSINKLSFDDIEHFFRIEREESDKIEFKSFVNGNERDYEARLGEILRTICAFLNSSGGLVIWGAPAGEKNHGKLEKVFAGSLAPINKPVAKDSFITKVADSINPSPVGVIFKLLEKNESYIVIVEVPQSDYSPHQFKDKYYMRLDGQSRTAPHHYIEALFKRNRYPKLECYLRPTKISIIEGNYILEFKVIILNRTKTQNEKNLFYVIMLSEAAEFLGWQSPDVNNISDNGHQMISSTPIPTLFYMQPRNFYINIKVKSKLLIKSNNLFQIKIQAGGDLSPLIESFCEIKCSAETGDDLNNIFTKIEENQFFHEAVQKTGQTEKDLISGLTGR